MTKEAMTELTFEEFCNLPIIYTFGIRSAWGAQRMYRNDRIGLQVEVATKQKACGDIYSDWHPEKRTYFLDGDNRQFDTIDQAYVAYMEKVCGVQA